MSGIKKSPMARTEIPQFHFACPVPAWTVGGFQRKRVQNPGHLSRAPSQYCLRRGAKEGGAGGGESPDSASRKWATLWGGGGGKGQAEIPCRPLFLWLFFVWKTHTHAFFFKPALRASCPLAHGGEKSLYCPRARGKSETLAPTKAGVLGPAGQVPWVVAGEKGGHGQGSSR